MTPRHIHAPPARMTGFTLLEMMVTLAVVAILLGIGVPSFADIIRNNRLTSASNDFLHSTHLARSEAVKRQMPVVVCSTSDANAEPPSCDEDGAFTQWIVFADADGDWTVDAAEEVVQRHDALPATVTVRNDNRAILSYAASGFSTVPPAGGPTPARNVVICDRRGNLQIGTFSTARAIRVAATGRTRVTKDFADVTAAIAAAGGCPR